MPRYEDRYGSTRLYVGRISSRTRSRDLEHLFSRYGRVRDVDMKLDYAFVEFSDPRDADDARHSLDGRKFDGSRIIVEFARGVPRGPGGSREHSGRGPTPGTGRCFNCGIDGHWARDCKAGDWKNKCYRCGERGHIEKNCPNSPQKLRCGRSFSRSPVRSRSPRRGRSRSRSYSRSCSYSRSRSPVKAKRIVVTEERRSRSPSYSRSPVPKKGASSPPSPMRDSPTLKEGSPVGAADDSFPKRDFEEEQNMSDYSGSPKRSRSPKRDISPSSHEKDSPPPVRNYESHSPANGPSPSPSPKNGGNAVVDDEDDDYNDSPRDYESPRSD